MTGIIYDVYKTSNGACTLIHMRDTPNWCDVQYVNYSNIWYKSGWDELHPPRNYHLVAKNVVFK